MNHKTFSAKAPDVERKWYVIDATDQILGRVAVQAANLLRGKNKAIFTPHVDTGDHVIIINAEKIRLSGNKENAKISASPNVAFTRSFASGRMSAAGATPR